MVPDSVHVRQQYGSSSRAPYVETTSVFARAPSGNIATPHWPSVGSIAITSLCVANLRSRLVRNIPHHHCSWSANCSKTARHATTPHRLMARPGTRRSHLPRHHPSPAGRSSASTHGWCIGNDFPTHHFDHLQAPTRCAPIESASFDAQLEFYLSN